MCSGELFGDYLEFFPGHCVNWFLPDIGKKTPSWCHVIEGPSNSFQSIGTEGFPFGSSGLIPTKGLCLFPWPQRWYCICSLTLPAPAAFQVCFPPGLPGGDWMGRIQATKVLISSVPLHIVISKRWPFLGVRRT